MLSLALRAFVRLAARTCTCRLGRRFAFLLLSFCSIWLVFFANTNTNSMVRKVVGEIATDPESQIYEYELFIILGGYLQGKDMYLGR